MNQRKQDGAMSTLRLTIALISIVILIAGCGGSTRTETIPFDYVLDTVPTSKNYHDLEETPVIELNNQAADTLFRYVTEEELSPNSPVYVKPFINGGNAGDQSIFGHIMSQQIRDRLVQRGVNVTVGAPKPTEYFKPQAPPTQPQNAMDEQEKPPLPPRAGVLEGSYVIGKDFIYMNASIIRLDDKVIVSAHNWLIPITENIRWWLPQIQPKDGLMPTVQTQFK